MSSADLLMSQTIRFLARVLQDSPALARKRRVTSCGELLSSRRRTPGLFEQFWNTFRKRCFQLCHCFTVWGRPRLKLTRQKPVHQLSVSLNHSQKQVLGLDSFVSALGEVPSEEDRVPGLLCEAWEE